MNIKQKRGSFKPPFGAIPDFEHPFMLNHIFSFYFMEAGFAKTPSSTIPFQTFFSNIDPISPNSTAPVAYTSNTGGGALNFTNTNANVIFSNLAGKLPTDQITVAMIRRLTDTTLRTGAVFGGNTIAARRIGAHCPWSDGNIYWDFGGTSSPNRLTVSGLSWNTLVESFVFVAGNKGSAVYRNGIKVGSQSTGISRTTSASDAFTINDGNGALSTTREEINSFIVINDQWSDEMVRWWAAEPYAHLYDRKIKTYMILEDHSLPTPPSTSFPALSVAM